MSRAVVINGRPIGPDHPVYIVAEIGINHNGDVELTKKLVDAAAKAGCDAVKFQKRTPELCVPPEQRNQMRQTPWGYITYLEYRYKVEFGVEEFREIDRHCRDRGIVWFSSCWDEPSVDFMGQFDPPCYKIPSASLTDGALLQHLRKTGRPLILSTGMSTMAQIQAAVDLLGTDDLIIMHSTSAYPCPAEELNLRMIGTLCQAFDCPIGYSGHEVGLPTTVAAVALGARMVERHITLDRAMWGSDQAASVEPGGMERLVHYIRVTEEALGDGVKRVYDSEIPIMKKLRRQTSF
jgi:N-acetylneuraminate synthase